MALAASDFTRQKVSWRGTAGKEVTGIWTGPASYASGGEVLTRAIARAAFAGMNEIHSLSFTPLTDNDNAALAVNVSFDHASDATTQGKIRALTSGGAAHLHSFLVKGGTAAGTTDVINIKSLVIGKEEATDRTNLGGATNGGVQNSTVVETSTEVAAATNLSGYRSRFVALGR